MIECNAKETAEIFKKANKIVLSAHVNPDGDALGSLLGLGMALKKIDKEVIYLIDDELPRQFSYLPSFHEIEKPNAYVAGLKADLFVVLDASDIERVGGAVLAVKADSTLNIDHHLSNIGFTDYRYLSIKSAATCEMIFDIINELNIEIDKDIATNIYTGIVTDCGFFRYANTTAQTMNIAATLIDYGVKPNIIADFLEMQTVDYLTLLPKILSTLEFFAENKIAVISIEPSLYEDDMDGDAFIKYPRYIEGVEVAILLKGISDIETRVSLRSKNIDVSKIALFFGGGGHEKAAGLTIKGNIDLAKKVLLEVLEKSFGDV